MTPTVALATCREVPDLLDDEGNLLLAALEDQGVACQPAIWDDDAVAWERFDLVVVRSTWGYPTRRHEFLAWAERVASRTRILNDPAVLRWTTDKHYLTELADAGTPTVPSIVVEPGEDPQHPFLDVEHVIKPAVSAGSRDTLRLAPADRDRAVEHMTTLPDAGRPVLVQPYQAAVDEVGETAVVAIEGRVAHAVGKTALLVAGADPVDGLFAPETITAREAGPAEMAVARAVLDHVTGRFGTPLHARVDLLPGADGPLVLECELAEPSLFLEHADGAAATLAEAIVARTNGTERA